MIEVTISRNGLAIKGHSGYAERGKDIVCSAVSALVMNFIEAVEQLTRDHIWYNIRDGDVTIEILKKSRDTKLLLKAFVVGLTQIENNYPKFIEITSIGKHR